MVLNVAGQRVILPNGGARDLLNRWTSSIGCLIAGVTAASVCMSAVGAQQPATAPSVPHRDLVSRYCISCHNERLKSGGLALDQASAQEIDRHPEVWEKVVRKLRVRQMPPPGLPRPDEATYEAEIASLVASLDAAATARPHPGRTATLRRLTRTEYQNAIRDLLAVNVDAASL